MAGLRTGQKSLKIPSDHNTLIMIIQSCFLFLSAVVITGCNTPNPENEKKFTETAGDPAAWVDPFIGTGGHGHTYPGAVMPFGMVQLSPDTRLTGWDGCSGYHYSDSVVYGFSHTHLSGTGVPDYCDILFMPTTGEALFNNGSENRKSGYASLFSHEEEEASPGYYRTRLLDYGIGVEVTVTPRTGFHKYTFPESERSNVIIDLQHRDRVIEAGIHIVNDSTVEGFRRSSSWADDQHIYFVAEFSRPFRYFVVALDDRPVRSRQVKGENVKGALSFATGEGDEILVKVGISATSIENARRNLKAENPGWNFDEIRKTAREEWNRELSRITVEGGAEDQKTVFYTALYHAFLAPNLYQDVDGSYRGRDLEVHNEKDFDYYTVFSLWDTFRAAHPLYTILQQDRTNDFIRTMIRQYEEGGRLPVWELAANETECMIGYHSVPVIADAYIKGIRDYDGELALEAMQHSAGLDHFGLEFYKKYGYIPAHEESESVSKTLEYAYDDWCIAAMAGAMGKEEVQNEYLRRAQYYKNLFDPATGFMRARMNGRWFEPFDPKEVNFNYTEANAWQYRFFVPQDVSGMMALMGGEQAFMDELDRLFTESPETTGRQQSDITGLIGQYAHGNEPSHHMAYLYHYAGRPDKSQKMVRKIMDELYAAAPDGLSGNEDCGQMSAWYVLSASGLYPVTPGSEDYVIGSPLFDRVTFHLENEQQFTITANRAGDEHVMVASATLNGKDHPFSWIRHSDIMKGGELKLEMSGEPKGWGTAKQRRPVSSIKKHLILPVPFLTSGERTFTDETEIALGILTEEADIYYTLDGSDPDRSSALYSEPFTLDESVIFKARAFREGMPPGTILEADFNKIPEGRSITLNTEYAGQYAAGGDIALIDFIRGPANFRTGAWQGYHGVDLDAEIDLGSIKLINKISVGFLQDQGSWIFMPEKVDYYVSNDGESYQHIGTVKNDVDEHPGGARKKDFTLNFATKARYVKVVAKNRGVCPEWHPGAGNKAWIFADEVVIE